MTPEELEFVWATGGYDTGVDVDMTEMMECLCFSTLYMIYE